MTAIRTLPRKRTCCFEYVQASRNPDQYQGMPLDEHSRPPDRERIFKPAIPGRETPKARRLTQPLKKPCSVGSHFSLRASWTRSGRWSPPRAGSKKRQRGTGSAQGLAPAHHSGEVARPDQQQACPLRWDIGRSRPDPAGRGRRSVRRARSLAHHADDKVYVDNTRVGDRDLLSSALSSTDFVAQGY